MKKVVRLRAQPDEIMNSLQHRASPQLSEQVPVRTTGRIKKPKAVFDPSDNYLPRSHRLGSASAPSISVNHTSTNDRKRHSHNSNSSINDTQRSGKRLSPISAGNLGSNFATNEINGSTQKEKTITYTGCSRKEKDIREIIGSDCSDLRQPQLKCVSNGPNNNDLPKNISTDRIMNGKRENSVEHRDVHYKKQKPQNYGNDVMSDPTLDQAKANDEVKIFEIANQNTENYQIPDVKTWSVDDVVLYFTKDFPNEAQVLRDHEIDGASLLLLKRSDIVKKLPLKLGPALRLYSLVLKLQTKSYDPTLGWNCDA